MAKARTLSGLAHDALDHAAGPFGLHPHVWEYAHQSGLTEVAIDLVNQPPIATPAAPEPLILASAALQQWFKEHVETYGFEIRDLQSAILTFGAFGSHSWAFGTTVTITTKNGRVFSRRSGWPPN